MMRRLLLLSIAALLAICSSNKEFNTNRYQKNGNVLSVEDGVDSYYEYKYDSHNNWIERIGYHGETRMPFEIVERTIEYRK